MSYEMVIFTRTFDLLEWLLPKSERFPRAYRSTLTQRLMDAALTSSSCCEIKYHPTFNLPASHPFEYAIDVLKLVGTDRRLYFAGAGEVERFLQVETRPDDRSPHRKAARAIEKARRIEGARRAGTCLRWCSRGRTGNRSAQKING
jgi:hypothetical protein